MPAGQDSDIAVVGAGIVGVTTAVALQRASYRVVLIDRNPVGAMTSYGNTGVLVENPWLGFSAPGLIRRLPGILVGRNPAVRIDAAFALRHFGLLARLVGHSLSAGADERVGAVHRLLRHSQAIHKAWIKEAQAQDLLRETGWLKVFRTARSVAAFRPELELLSQTRTRHRLLPGSDIGDLEPALVGPFVQGVLLEDACSVSSPLHLTHRYFDLFRRRGGRFETAEVGGMEPSRHGWTLDCGASSHAVDHVVIAVGPWASDLLAQLGYRVPLLWERGYHRHLLPGGGPALRRPVHEVDAGFVMTPQLQGVRVTSGVEIAHRDAPPCYRQIDQAVTKARAAAGLGEPVDPIAWLGSRPTLPDGLPMIGRAPRHSGLWFNFGHHHIGLSMAAGGAQLLADMMTGAPPLVDPQPFDPARLIPA